MTSSYDHSNSIAYALREFFEEQLPEFVTNLPALSYQVFWAFVAPGLSVLALLAAVGTAAYRVKLILYPSGPSELHSRAMTLLQQQQQQYQQKSPVTTKKKGPFWKSSKQPYQQVISLLQTAAIEHKYAPALLSLAALYIYKLHDGKAAIQLLKSSSSFLLSPSTGTNQNSNDCKHYTHAHADAQSLLLDAQALLAGHGDMNQSDIRADEFLSLSYCVTSSVRASNSASTTPAPATLEDSKKMR